MLITDITQWPDGFKGRLLGIDHGAKYIGLAISDAALTMAQPLATIIRKSFAYDMQQLQAIIHEHYVGALAIGYPLNMDGTQGARCQAVRAFVRQMEAYIDLPTVLWDERLSSAAAEAKLQNASKSATQRKTKIHESSAAVILQSLLDKLDTAL